MIRLDNTTKENLPTAYTTTTTKYYETNNACYYKTKYFPATPTYSCTSTIVNLVPTTLNFDIIRGVAPCSTWILPGKAMACLDVWTWCIEYGEEPCPILSEGFSFSNCPACLLKPYGWTAVTGSPIVLSVDYAIAHGIFSVSTFRVVICLTLQSNSQVFTAFCCKDKNTDQNLEIKT